MHPDDAFDEYQPTVNAEIEHVREARRRRDVFCDAFGPLEDVNETVPSGSLARGTQRDPIHDVDVIIVFDSSAHPGWDNEAGSANAALEYARDNVNALLSHGSGTYAREVRHTLLRNHVVKCFLDDPDDPDAFAVEVMPVLRVEEGLRIPERNEDRWVTADPEYLIDQVAARHDEWRCFAPMVRVIKEWKDVAGLDMKSLVAEVLALNCLPRPAPGAKLSRSMALARFFTAAATAVMSEVSDPAGWCGEIQPDLDRGAVRGALLEASDLAERALEAERRGDHDVAVCLWRAVFGKEFPQPPGGCPDGARGTVPAAIAAPALIRRRPVKDSPQG